MSEHEQDQEQQSDGDEVEAYGNRSLASDEPTEPGIATDDEFEPEVVEGDGFRIP